EAQEKQYALVKGSLQFESKAPVSNETVAIPYLRMLTTTDGKGHFTLTHVPFGIHRIVIGEGRMAADTISVSINEETVNLGVLTLAANEAMISSAQQLLLPTIALEDRDSDEENGGATGVSSLLTAS